MSRARTRVDTETTAAALVVGATLARAAMAITGHAAGEVGHWSCVAGGRLSFGLLTAYLLVRSLKQGPVGLPVEPWAWVRVFASSLGVPAAFGAIVLMPPADAVTIMNMGPLWVLVWSALIHRKAPPLRSLVGLGVAICGVALMNRPGFAVLGLGLVAAVFNSAMRGLAIVSSARVSKTPAAHLVFQATAGGAIMAALIASGFAATASEPLVSSWSEFLPLAVVVGFLGTVGGILATRGLMAGSAVKLAPLMFLAPVFALLGEALLGESIGLLRVAGVALVVAGTLWASAGASAKRLVVIRPTTAALPDIESLTTLCSEVESVAQVELRVHLMPETVENPGDQAVGIFEQLEMDATTLGHGLLIFRSPGTRVLVADVWLERRLVGYRLDTILELETEEAFWNALAEELARQVPTRAERENELADDITVGALA